MLKQNIIFLIGNVIKYLAIFFSICNIYLDFKIARQLELHERIINDLIVNFNQQHSLQ